MSDFIRVCKTDDLPDPGMKVFEVEDCFVVLFHVDGRFWALDDRCTHDGGPLGEGTLEGLAIECPRHGAKFDIRDGRVLCMPATSPTVSHQVKVEAGEVYVKLTER